MMHSRSSRRRKSFAGHRRGRSRVLLRSGRQAIPPSTPPPHLLRNKLHYRRPSTSEFQSFSSNTRNNFHSRAVPSKAKAALATLMAKDSLRKSKRKTEDERKRERIIKRAAARIRQVSQAAHSSTPLPVESQIRQKQNSDHPSRNETFLYTDVSKQINKLTKLAKECPTEHTIPIKVKKKYETHKTEKKVKLKERESKEDKRKVSQSSFSSSVQEKSKNPWNHYEVSLADAERIISYDDTLSESDDKILSNLPNREEENINEMEDIFSDSSVSDSIWDDDGEDDEYAEWKHIAKAVELLRTQEVNAKKKAEETWLRNNKVGEQFSIPQLRLHKLPLDPRITVAWVPRKSEPKPPLTTPPTVYEECFDESGNVFYYNTRTKKSQWQKPMGRKLQIVPGHVKNTV